MHLMSDSLKLPSIYASIIHHPVQKALSGEDGLLCRRWTRTQKLKGQFVISMEPKMTLSRVRGRERGVFSGPK